MGGHYKHYQMYAIRCKRSMTPFINDYSLNDQILNLSGQHTYLGVTIHKHLFWTPHITGVVVNASRTLNFWYVIYPTLQDKVKNLPTLRWLGNNTYIGCLGPVEDIVELEKVQQRAACWVMNDYGRCSSVTSMLKQFSWPAVQFHRKSSRLQTLHKAL